MHLSDSSLLATDAFIGGEWVGSSERFVVRDPARGTVLAEVADCDRAIAAEGWTVRALIGRLGSAAVVSGSP